MPTRSGSESTQPTLSEIGVIALVPDHWGPKWQVRHQVLSRLAKHFHVVWVDYPPRLKQTLATLQSRREAAKDPHPLPANFEVYQPELWLPRLGRPAWLGRRVWRERLKRAADRLRSRGCNKIVLYIWRPEFAEALNQGSYDFSIYHVDDEYSFSSTEMGLSLVERQLLESVGQVFIHSPAMMDKKGGFNPHTEFVPNGVDYQLYATSAPEPEDLRDIPRPRIGYVGSLKRMLDWDLLLELASGHPPWSFVFVGPKAPHRDIDNALERISSLPNVHFLGAKPTGSLGAYPQHFDVCTMPYVLDDYTKYVYPLKMHEYLASGRPVVSAPIRSVEEFRKVITVAGSSQEWSKAIENSLSAEENTKNRRSQRQEVALEHDWRVLVDHIAQTIAGRLGLEIRSTSGAATASKV